MADLTSSPNAIPSDDRTRRATLFDPDDPGLPHVGIDTGTYTILISGADTQGHYSLIDMLVPPNGGPPPHRHDFEEMFDVVDGELEVTFRSEPMRLRARQSLNIPANAPHGLRVISDAPARVMCLFLPAGQEEFFLKVGDRLLSRTAAPPVLTAEAVAQRRALAQPLAWRSHSEFLPPPER